MYMINPICLTVLPWSIPDGPQEETRLKTRQVSSGDYHGLGYTSGFL